MIQTFMGFLDLLGVALIGILGALAVSGLESKQPGDRVSLFINFFHIGHLKFQQQAAILGTAAVLVMVTRTAISITFTRRTLHFLSRRGALISRNLVAQLLRQPLTTIQSKTLQESIYSVTDGVKTITLGIIGTTVSLISDCSLLFVMSIGLFVVDPTIALTSSLIFGSLGWILYSLMHKRARSLGTLEAELNIESNKKITEVLTAYREAVVRNRRDFYANRIGEIRQELAYTLAEISFMPNVSKYVIETSVLIGALLIGAIQFLLQDATHAVATLSIFLAAGTRIAPAALRLQQGALSIKSAIGSATPTLKMIEELNFQVSNDETQNAIESESETFNPKVLIRDLEYSYPGSSHIAISIDHLEILSGQTVAIVGESGAGKTTLVDLLLGVLKPNKGSVILSGKSPEESISTWPGAISYVPQDVVIIDGSIRENVSMGYPVEDATDDLVWNALSIAQLDEFVRALPKQLDNLVGERGTGISGGQRQRLGIARAMFTNPELLVLDEATSALDGQTEAEFSKSLETLHGKKTIILIAHRLATIQRADCIYYIQEGNLVAKGNFSEITKSVPNFAAQVKLSSINSDTD